MKKIIFFGLLAIVLISLFLLVYAQDGVTVTLNAPTGGAWIASSVVSLNFTPSGNTSANAGYNCTLFANFNGTWSDSWTGNANILTPHNLTNLVTGTTYNFSIQGGLKENSSGYIWNVGCVHNSTGIWTNAGSNMSFGTNATFRLDYTVPTVPTIATPTNGSVLGSVNPFVEWKTSGDVSFRRYKVQFSNGTDFEAVDILKEKIITVNTTNTSTFPESLDGNRLYYLRVLAEDEAGNTNFESVNTTIVTSSPSISIINYSNGTYLSENMPNFSIIVTHQFVDRCQLWTTNQSNDTSVDLSFATNQSKWTLNYTIIRANGSIVFNANMSDGIYRFGFVCNNTGGNTSGFTVNRTLILDNVVPDPFGCISPINNSKRIDHTPMFVWNTSTDTYFGNYTTYVDNNSDFSSPEFIGNQTAEATKTNFSNITVDLRRFNQSDRTWYFNVTATDKAGNVRTNSNCTPWAYRTDITNSYLKSGWNLVAIMQSGNINASDLAEGVGVSWNTVTRFNSSKQFLNYNNGSTTNNGMVFKKGDVVFINVNADTYWENQTWDTTVNYNDGNLFNLTNTSNGWNVFGMQNQSGFKMGQIELGILKSNIPKNNTGEGNSGTEYFYEFKNVTLPLNNSLQSIVYFNNTAVNTRKFVLHPFNYSNANTTLIDFGEVVWININASINGTTNLMILNMTLMGDVA